MIPAGPAMRQLLDGLASALDDEARLLELSRAQLAGLTQAALQRDEERLGQLLDEIQTAERFHETTERTISDVRRALADKLACSREQVTLGWLSEHLPQQERTAIQRRKDHIARLLEGLQKEHLETAMVLGECARVNRRLLEGLFPQASGTDTYTHDGHSRWRPDGGVIDAER